MTRVDCLHQIVDNFVATGPTHDTIAFAANVFRNSGALHHAMSQHGGDTVITRDAADSITLVGVQLKSLVSTDFKFV
jgi:serralysin